MTDAQALDTISLLSGMSGEVNDAVSACSQVKMSDADRLLSLPETECPTVWIRLPRNRRPKRWDNIDDPMVPLKNNIYIYIFIYIFNIPLGGMPCTQLGMSLCSPTSSTLLISFR